MLSIAQTIVKNGFVVMSTAFQDVFTGVKYSIKVACHRFQQMFLVCIIVGEQKSGRSLAYLLENNAEMNYQGIYQLFTTTHKD